jgi:potassium voltage-gated channel Shaker-related subfamily A member 2
MEFVLRLYATAKRYQFITNVLNLIDLVAILPFYINLLPLSGSSSDFMIRLVKVFRIFRFGRDSTGLRLLLVTLQQSRGELSVMCAFLTMGVVLFGSALYFTEGDTESRPY